MRRFTVDIAPVLALVAILLASTSMMNSATEDSTSFGEMYSVLLIVNAVGLLGLAGLIGWNLMRLVQQVRSREAGARLTVRMVSIFVALALAPVLVLYYFSVQTIHRGVDSWFDVRIEQALSDALELGQASLGTRMRELSRSTRAAAADLELIPDDGLAVALSDIFAGSSAGEMTVIDARGNIIASSIADPTKLVPTPVDETLVIRVQQSQSYVGLEPVADSGLHIRALVPFLTTSGGANRYLHALYPVDERVAELASSVESAFDDYSELTYLREPLKFSFTLTLSVALLLSMFAAAWIAFFSARRMVAPLQNLARATHAVAEGDYETRLAWGSDDELGFLVESFNDMTRRLGDARDETRRSQVLEEEQRNYLEAVLTRMSSGVITIDDTGAIVRINIAASEILSLGTLPSPGTDLASLTNAFAHLSPFSDAVQAHLHAADADWRTEVRLFGPKGRQVLVCRGTALPGHDGQHAGHIVVFDDLTALIEAQRNAAWSEVARRLAHEIKNPLTPIQLSAERLRHKYLVKLGKDEGALMDRLTRTIVNQVESMKEMVNAFSAYARSPSSQPEPLDLNVLVNDITALYSSKQVGVDLSEDLPLVNIDADRIRQLLHNLIKNALEACEDETEKPVMISTNRSHTGADEHIELRVRDRGPGIAEDLLESLFEPYVTNKSRGTGLGLAIVKKIAEEHGGAISASNCSDGGAQLTLRLRAASEHSAPESTINQTNEK